MTNDNKVQQTSKPQIITAVSNLVFSHLLLAFSSQHDNIEYFCCSWCFLEVYSKTLLYNHMIQLKPWISDFSLGHPVTVTLKNKSFKPSVVHKYSKHCEEMCPFNEVQYPYYRGVSDERFYCISVYSLHIWCLFLLRVYWCVLDGADCNRLFIKMHFHNKDPVDSKFVATNIYTGGPMIFIMDPKVKSKYILSHGTLTI